MLRLRIEARTGFVGASSVLRPSLRFWPCRAIPPTRAPVASGRAPAYHTPPPISRAYAAIVVDANSGNGPACGQCRRAAPSGFADQDHDALSAVRAARIRQAQARQPVAGVRARRGAVAHQARPARRLDHPVEDAIKGMVTRSANDAAVVVGENLGGSEAEFGAHDDAQGARARHEPHRLQQCLRPARRRTGHDGARPGDPRPRHPGALPDAITSISRLRSFVYHGQSIGNHNHLLGRVEGVDGIKTGYTRASGFNLVTSVHRDNRYVVAVVLGGASAGSRDARMRTLLDQYRRQRRPSAPGR